MADRAGDSFAASTSPLLRFTLKAIKGTLAPTAAAPERGSNSAGPASGLQWGSFNLASSDS